METKLKKHKRFISNVTMSSKENKHKIEDFYDILSNQGCLVIMLSSEMDNNKNFSIKRCNKA